MEFLSCFDLGKQVSLYIHIPFCISKCSYCAFYSKALCTDSLISSYVEKLCSEINAVTSSMDRAFYTAFIGGGNPGCLTVEQLERICRSVCRNGRPEEFTCEMNPESLKEEHFPLFEKFLTRLSMGIQSLDEGALSFLGRNCSRDKELSAVSLAVKLREKSGAVLNFDIICCLPNGHDSADDIRKIVSLSDADHISLYALSIEEGTALYRKGINPMSDDEEAVSLKRLWALLKELGYEHYEVSNFAKERKKSIHNTVYWDYGQYIGLGCAAASTGFKDGRTFRVENRSDIEQYANSRAFSTYEITELTAEESRTELIMLGLRHTKGLSLKRLESIRGSKISIIPPGFSISEGHMRPNEEGLLTADAAALSVDSSL